MAKKTHDAYSSGMRGSEKGGSRKQGANTKVGNPAGEPATAHSSGMRGNEKPKQDTGAQNLTTSTGSAAGGENARTPNSHIGDPGGLASKPQHVGASLEDAALQSHTSGAYKMGIDGNNTERAAAGMEPDIQEDDTHLNIRIPKASIKRGR